MDNEAKPIIFDPSNEPYLGVDMLHQLDNMIICFCEENEHIAKYTRENKTKLSELEKAGCALVPAAFSLILSVRELLRQGYLYGAAVLLRPIVERTSIISYLCDHPESIKTWSNGWKHGERPSFYKLIENLAQGKEVDGKEEFTRILHSLVHGTEDSLTYGAVGGNLGQLGFSSGKVLNNPEKCNEISLITCMMLIVLLARRTQVFANQTYSTFRGVSITLCNRFFY